MLSIASSRDQGFVVLAISDEETAKVAPFINQRKISYPVLLDPGRKVNDLFVVEGIPKSLVSDRNGKMVAQSIDMRAPGLSSWKCSHQRACSRGVRCDI